MEAWQQFCHIEAFPEDLMTERKSCCNFSHHRYLIAAPSWDSVASLGGSMEGKETRFGVGGSSLWAAATTAASNGSVNAMHDSLTPLGGMITMFLMQLGEVVFGGVGCGLYGMRCRIL